MASPILRPLLTLDRFVAGEGMGAVDPAVAGRVLVNLHLRYEQQVTPYLDERRVTRIEQALMQASVLP